MACINPDGSLTRMARKVLFALRSPGTAVDIADLAGVPLYRARASLRELGEAGLVIHSGELYEITDAGREYID